MSLLMLYPWPDNVRELKSAFEYAFVTYQESMIQPYHLPPAIYQTQPFVKKNKNSPLNRNQMKAKELMEALESTGGNQSRVTKILGISRVTVWNRMRRYGITAQKKYSR